MKYYLGKGDAVKRFPQKKEKTNKKLKNPPN
jgi:hypothetical protein